MLASSMVPGFTGAGDHAHKEGVFAFCRNSPLRLNEYLWVQLPIPVEVRAIVDENRPADEVSGLSWFNVRVCALPGLPLVPSLEKRSRSKCFLCVHPQDESMREIPAGGACPKDFIACIPECEIDSSLVVVFHRLHFVWLRKTKA